MNIRRSLQGLVLAAAFGGVAAAEDAKGPIPIEKVKLDRPVDFVIDVLPILKRSCLSCHHAPDPEGQLSMETAAMMVKGGENGPAVVVGKPMESQLIKSAAKLEKPFMPPKNNKAEAPNLTPKELGLLSLWIEQGAKGPARRVLDEPKWQPAPLTWNPIFALAMTRDGRYVAASRANRIYLYDAPTQRFLAQLSDPKLDEPKLNVAGIAHRDAVQSMAFSPDGSLLASGGYRGIKLWRAAIEEQTFKLAFPPDHQPKLAVVSPDGKLAATAGADTHVRLWELPSGKAVGDLAGHAGLVTTMAFTRDGKRLATAGVDRTLRLWNTAGGAPLGRIDMPTEARALSWVRDDTQIITGDAERKTVTLWQAPSPAPATIDGVPGPVAVASLSTDGKMFALAGADNAIYLADPIGGKVLKKLAGHGAAKITALSWNGDGKKLLSGGADKIVKVWDVDSGNPVATLLAGTAPVDAAAINATGTFAAASTGDGKLAYWKLDTAAPKTLGEPLEQPAAIVAVNADRRLIAFAGTAGGKPAVIVRELATGNLVKAIPGHEAKITALAFSPDSARVVTGSEDKSVRVWNLADGAQQAKFDVGQVVTAVAMHPNNTQVLAACADNSMKLWTLADGKEAKAFAGLAGPVVAAVIPPNVGQVITIGSDKTLRWFKPDDGAQVRSIDLPGPATAMALSADNTKLAVAAADNIIRLYNVADGAPQQIFTAHTAAITSLAFNADATKLVSTGADKVATVWEMETLAALETVGAAGGVTYAAFGPQPGEVIVAGGDKAVRSSMLWATRIKSDLKAKVAKLVFTKDSVLVAGCADGTVRGFGPDGAQRFAAVHGGPVRDVAAAANGQWIASVGETKELKVWNAGNGGAVQSLGGFAEPPRTVAFSPDGTLVIAGGAGPAAGAPGQPGVSTAQVLLFDLQAPQPPLMLVRGFADHTDAVTAIAIAGAKGSEVVVTASADKTVRTRPLGRAFISPPQGWTTTSFAAAPGDPKSIWAGGDDGQARLLTLENGQSPKQLNVGGAVSLLAARPGEVNRLAAVTSMNLKLMQVDNGQAIADLRTDSAARKAALQGTAETAFAMDELNYLNTFSKESEERFKKEQEEVKKATDAVPALETAVKEKTEAMGKATTEREASDKTLAEATKVVTDGKAKVETLAKALEQAGKDKEAADKAVPEAQKLADAAKAALDAATKAVSDEPDAEKKKPLEAARVAAEQKQKEAVAAVEAKKADAQAKLQAMQKADQDKKTADQEVVNADNKVKEVTKTNTESKNKEDQAKQAVEVATRNVESGKRRIEKAMKEVVVSEKASTDSKASAAKATEDHKGKQEKEKQAAEAVAKAALPIRAVAYSADGAILVTGSEDGKVYVYGGDKGRDAAVLASHAAPVLSLSFTADGKLLSLAADGSVRIGALTPTWKLERAIEPKGPGDPPVDRVLSLVFSPDGKTLASGGGVASREGEVLFWNVEDGKLLREIKDAHSDTVFDLAYSPDGTRLATVAADKFTKVWDAATGSIVQTFEGHTSHVLSVSWNHNGRTLATAGADNVIKVWSLVTGQQVKTIEGYKHQVICLRHRGYSREFVVAWGEGVRVSNEDGNNNRNFEVGPDFTYRVALSEDGKLLATGGQDGVLRLFNAENSEPLGKFDPPGTKKPETAKAN
jgi:WD40 repeat protein